MHQRWQAEGAFDVVREYFDEVLIYGSQDVYDVCREYGWPAELIRLVKYCGYLCTPEAPVDPKRLRARRLEGMPRGTLIVAMAGGGADAHGLMSTLLDALPQVVAAKPCVLELVTGPFMPEATRRRLAAGASSGTRVMAFVPGLEHLIAADPANGKVARLRMGEI